MSDPTASVWIDAVVSLLLLNGAVFCVIGAIGLLRLPHFFLRAHPCALPYTMGTWSIALASMIHFTRLQASLSVQAWAIVILLSIGAPVAVALLARGALFRLRRAASAASPVPVQGRGRTRDRRRRKDLR